ncbi:MAG: gamma-glutamylcyclotransferase [Deltaproteobacteria bacterium]|nr:gamma-glutamylcyclotransferase [Deltaproteobacteria bacterium]
MSLVWYFAYGSNLQSGTLRGRRGVEVRRAVPMRAPGWRLVFDKPRLFGGGSVANIVPDDQSHVVGVAFEISKDDHAHVELTEGVAIGHYARVELAIEPIGVTDGAPRAALSLSSNARDAALRPSTRYMGLVIDGAVEHGLPDGHLEFLRSVPTCEESAAAAALRPMIDALMKRR